MVLKQTVDALGSPSRCSQITEAYTRTKQNHEAIRAASLYHYFRGAVMNKNEPNSKWSSRLHLRLICPFASQSSKLDEQKQQIMVQFQWFTELIKHLSYHPLHWVCYLAMQKNRF